MDIVIALILIWILVLLIKYALSYLLFFGGVLIAYQVYLYFFLKGEKFKQLKIGIQSYITNCNELNEHIDTLKQSYANVKRTDYGDGVLVDESMYNIKRKNWNKFNNNIQIYNCSALVCKNALDQPFKYLCKYFNIKANEDTLSNFENVLNDFSAAEQGKLLLINEREAIFENIQTEIPQLIRRFSKKKIIKELGFKEILLDDVYFPQYTFQYISAGGNSSMKCDIMLNVENLDKFVSYLNELIKFKNSIAGQRALMTSKLREIIKQRDNCTCQICKISTYEERNLLLEIDHIIPLSKGGITTEANLQTLCWRCNRTKGSKILPICM
jgi:hypothetical protein